MASTLGFEPVLREGGQRNFSAFACHGHAVYLQSIDSTSLLRRILILNSNRRAEGLSLPLRWDTPSFLTKHHWGRIKISCSILVANYLDDEFKISSAEKNSVSVYIRGNSSLKGCHKVNTIKEFLRLSISSIFYPDIYCQNSKTSKFV